MACVAAQSVKPLHDEMLHNMVFCLEQKNEVIVQMLASYSWFLFELLIKAMVRFLQRQKLLGDEGSRPQRFSPAFANVRRRCRRISSSSPLSLRSIASPPSPRSRTCT